MMDVDVMRSIDRRLGVPLCRALTWHRRLRGDRPPPNTPERMLIIKLGEQGATVVAASALQRAIDMVGRENVFMMVFAENRFILDQMDVIPPENVIEVRTDHPLRFALDVLGAIRRSRRVAVDLAVDFEFFARSSAVIAYLSGARRRVGFHAFAGEASYRGDLMTHRLVYNPRLHAAEVFLRLVEAATVDPGALPSLDLAPAVLEVPAPIVPSDTERDGVLAMLASLGHGVDRPRLVLLNANASDLIALRRWPEERYVELAHRMIAAHDDVVVAFTGSPAEAASVAELAAAVGSPRSVSVGGRTTMRELLVLYGLAEVMVTNDSGPAHYAALADLDVVTLFGPETPAVFGSLSPRSHILWAGVPCSPCVNAFNDRTSPCRDNICMQRITVDEVFSTVEGILGVGPGPLEAP